MAGRKFNKNDLAETVVCGKCLDFLKNMESSIGPKTNKITGAGKERVFRLMEKKRIPTSQAIEIVLAEQRAKEMLVAAGLKRLDKDGNLLPVNKPAAAPVGGAKALPSLLDFSPKGLPPRMSGAQRKKFNILVAGGMDPNSARELVIAASLANSGNLTINPLELAQNLQGGTNEQDQPARRKRVRTRNRRRGDGPAVNDQQNGNQANDDAPVKRVVTVKQNANNQPKPVQNPKGPAQKVAATAANKKVNNSPGILIPQSMRQNNSSGGGAGAGGKRAAGPSNSDRRGGPSNSDRRVGAIAAPRRNERPAPYNQNNSNNNNNNNRRQQNISPWQRSSNQSDNNSINNFNQQLKSLQQQIAPQQSQNNSCEVGIVPIKYPNDMLDNLKLDALKEAITNEILKIPQGGPLIRFLGTSSQNGWLKVICADQLSRNWLAMLVSRWERAGIRLVEGNNMPQAATLSFYLENDFRSADEILSIIEKQNDSLNTNQWRLVDCESDGHGQRITICVNEQCFQALQQRDFMVFLGLGVVELKPRNSNQQNSLFNMNLNNNNGNYNSNGGNFSNGGNNNMQGGGGGGGNRSNDYGRGSYNRNGNHNQNQNMNQRGGYQNQRVW